MKMNYELDKLNECHCMNLAAKAANYTNSYPFATKLQNFVGNNSYYSCHS